MSKCAHIKKIIGRYIDNELPPPEYKNVMEHLAACVECRSYFENQQQFIVSITETLNERAGQSPEPVFYEEIVNEGNVSRLPEKQPVSVFTLIRTWILDLFDDLMGSFSGGLSVYENHGSTGLVRMHLLHAIIIAIILTLLFASPIHGNPDLVNLV